ncbi:MAG: DUF3604 domain-containing protein [Nitrosomonas sp.]|nr:MAG: DUF3604 domain-containing protein [Nitrosomonas sp.]
MRRSICFCEPNVALAGELNTWKFIYTTTITLPKNTRMRFDLGTKGRDIDWQLPDVDPEATENSIYMLLPNGKTVNATQVEPPDSFTPHYEFKLPTEVPAGKNVIIFVGAPQKISSKKKTPPGNAAQTMAQRRRPFFLYVDPTGKGHYGEAEVFSLDVRGGPLSTIKILTPSFVTRNKRFDVIVRFEDEFGNLTNNAPEDTLIELSHEHLRENLKWRIFVPETGFIALPNHDFEDPGIYTIRLHNTKTKQTFSSSPIKCFAESDVSLFWGLLHGESERFDSTESIEPCLRHFRDDRALNFYGTSSFESIEETPVDIWKQVSQTVVEFNEDERFNALLGFQWVGAPGEEGARLFVYSKDNKPVLRKKDPKFNGLKKIYKQCSTKEVISIPTFTMGKGFHFDFTKHDPEFERVVEIYNAWGSSECSAKEGNTRPIRSGDKKGIQEVAECSIQNALKNNIRVGFVGGGLDDRGIYGEFYDSDQEQYSPGLTAIVCKDQTRQGLLEALYQRSCYATTGERIIVNFTLAGKPMGSEVSTADKAGLMVNRHISGTVAGTKKISKIEIIRNGKVIHTLQPDGYSTEFVYDDLDPLSKVTIRNKDKNPPFAYYYIRVTQEDGHMAWSSPIWVDEVPIPAGKATASRRLPAKAAPPPINFDIDEEEEEEIEIDDDDDDDDDI